MRKKIVISALLNQIQVGLSENGHLVEYYWEPDCKKRLLGNIYKGRVENILPGMEAAFIDIGLEKNAFLYVADLYARQAGQAIQELLKVGQSILVQVFKEADGTKGPRVTTEIALPGRYLVLLPFQDHAGVSRQITADEERNRLREIAEQIRPPKMGLIIRTVAEGSGQKELEADLKYLRKEWRKIEAKAKKSTLSTLVYQDDDLIHRILRDFLTPGVTEIIVDNTKLHRRVLTELKDLKVKQPVDVIYYGGPVSLFEYLGLNQDLERARKKKVWLDCGGYLVFDQTEALLSIDVNTGGYVGGEDLRATVLKTNLQAAQEIAYQLRLRNIGGIVIIDFIDMPKEDQEAVADKLRQ
ncbi:MAG: Rne/Rng family ribonuclease, partial [Firmicutes bacterium]|nr:Rne/Rng family ribonuclease [Bacillota bacterium]